MMLLTSRGARNWGLQMSIQTSPEVHIPSEGSPYCSDPNCQSCKELREVQEAIRRHEPSPSKKTA
jgi:hypothetical protein